MDVALLQSVHLTDKQDMECSHLNVAVAACTHVCAPFLRFCTWVQCLALAPSAIALHS